MELSKQVCSLEQAKKLKELGVNADSLFYHVTNENWPNGKHEDIIHINFHGTYKAIGCTFYPAFTVAELGVMMPTDEDGVGEYYSMKDFGFLIGSGNKHDVDGFSVSEAFPVNRLYQIPEGLNGVFLTEAQARAGLLIHLLQNGKVTSSDCNARLLNT